MKICEYFEFDVNFPSASSLAIGAAYLPALIPCTIGISNSDNEFNAACNFFNNNSYTLGEVNAKSIYILTDREYEKSDLRKYEGGKFEIGALDSLYTCVDWFGDPENFWHGLFEGLCAISIGPIVSTVVKPVVNGYDVVRVKNSNCYTVKYDGPYPTYNFECGLLSSSMYEYINNIDNYKECGNNELCKSKYLEKIPKLENNIKSQCSSILKNYNYRDGQAECINECLKIKDTLNSFTKGTDLYKDFSNKVNECEFSEKLISFILNITKWVKYIIPAVLIILSILDFINAMASDADDEMKKAKSRFIKRLIAAGLIFIVPLIVEFVLDKMGFVENIKKCGIIDF